ncbi:hypothetical protein ACNKHK_21810 [Shigella flexneri]
MQWRDVYLLAASPAKSEETDPVSPLLFQLPLLIHWQPSLGGRDGADIAAGCYPADVCQLAARVNVSRFSLSAEGTELLLTLKLERLNDG